MGQYNKNITKAKKRCSKG